MTRCERCGRTTPTPVRVVTRTRPRTYPPRSKANFVRQRALQRTLRQNKPITRDDVRRLAQGKRKWIARDDPGGVGWEIVHEGMFCPDCAEEFGRGAREAGPPRRPHRPRRTTAEAG